MKQDGWQRQKARQVLFGMFISLLILMLGLNCYVMCRHISSQNTAAQKFGWERGDPEGAVWTG